MEQVNIFQWNVLTQAFCNHKSYPEDDYSEEALDEETRRQKVLARIRQAMDENRIIVLHEVDYKLRGKLLVLSEEREFGMASQGHGYWRNWYMGSAILWPRKLFALRQAEFLTVGDLIKQNYMDPTPEPGLLETIALWGPIRMVSTPVAAIYRWVSGTKPPVNSYRKAVGRSNVLIHIKLENRLTKQSFHVWGYHMPCAFRNTVIMEYHAAQAIDSIVDAEDGMHVLCMDGNFQPNAPIYQRFIDADFISSAAVSGGEPEWTCRSNSCWSGEFTGTIDYVWSLDTSQGSTERVWKHAVCFPRFQDMSKPYLPTADFPSDHLWMEVTMENRIRKRLNPK